MVQSTAQMCNENPENSYILIGQLQFLSIGTLNPGEAPSETTQ